MNDAKLFYIGVKGLVRNAAGDYLLLKSNPQNSEVNVDPYWDIPGGRIKGTEDSLVTLRREIFEETGISAISDIQFLTATLSVLVEPVNVPGLALFVYTVTTPETKNIVIDSKEHTEYGWFTSAEAAKLLSAKYSNELTDKL